MIIVWGNIDLVKQGDIRKAIDVSGCPEPKRTRFLEQMTKLLTPSVNSGIVSLRCCEKWDELNGEEVENLTPDNWEYVDS